MSSAAPAEVQAAAEDQDSLAAVLRARWEALKGGDVGNLPVIVGIIAITIFFTSKSGGNSNTRNPGDIYIWGAPTLTIPIGTTPGTYYIGILMDPSNAVAESDESNNYASTAITVVAPLPDLYISSGAPTPTPTSIRPGGTMTLTGWTVQNRGTAAAGLFSNGFYLSTDATITAADTYIDGNANALAAGASFAWGGPTLIIPIGTTPGSYYIGILVDSGGGITESDETNNYVSTAITVIPGP